ncbi:heterokaryon incompatibility protein-domain-containing protein [Dactylonectria macrodidyma]|uniref:Heterokaryon incompatibility protein-domain-containing protein n=1 Tax=Dactylonectria macrodidyma TaxID=307937 RepID=A0A9P9DVS8_9HYPO|nr:heterokaryon incompatibility protein-domain-containing protein [Dactylonectria macrodidyma]
MRLINTYSLKLESFFGHVAPPYAILSHTWGEDECTFDYMRRGSDPNLKNPAMGVLKILNTCRQARRAGLHYAWVDTCCIDKSNSTELFEAINSMFKWYNNSAACYVFMGDVVLEADGTMAGFHNSRWFTRGWTLQEMIAPHEVEFFDRDWHSLGHRHELVAILHQLTHVFYPILARQHCRSSGGYYPGIHCRTCKNEDTLLHALDQVSIAGKMKWAANRLTTREEDMAYSLMGLFGVAMPLLYGEGKIAFQRLQQEILKIAPDQSILTWTAPPCQTAARLLASYLPERPSAFQIEAHHRQDWRLGATDIAATMQGLEVDVRIGPCVVRARASGGETLMGYHNLFLAALGCTIEADYLVRVAILVEPICPDSPIRGFRRRHQNSIVILRPGTKPEFLGSLCTNSFFLDSQVGSVSVECDVMKFTPQRILLPSRLSQHDNFADAPQLKLAVRGCDMSYLRAIHPQLFRHEILVPDEEFPPAPTIGNRVIYGVLFFSDGKSGFFVLWGVKNPGDWEPTTTQCKFTFQNRISVSAPRSKVMSSWGGGITPSV